MKVFLRKGFRDEIRRINQKVNWVAQVRWFEAIFKSLDWGEETSCVNKQGT